MKAVPHRGNQARRDGVEERRKTRMLSAPGPGDPETPGQRPATLRKTLTGICAEFGFRRRPALMALWLEQG